jgi:hypothetical protein
VGARKHETRLARFVFVCLGAEKSNERVGRTKIASMIMSGGDREASSSRGVSNSSASSSSGGGGASSAMRGSGGGGGAHQRHVGGGAGASRSSAAASGAAGRERAIETILDRDPRGCYYRAARVVVRRTACS